jgi:hypothetical protein
VFFLEKVGEKYLILKKPHRYLKEINIVTEFGKNAKHCRIL